MVRLLLEQGMRIFIGLIFLTLLGCSKTSIKQSLVDDNEVVCVQPKTFNDGDTVLGQYIVAYNVGIASGRFSARQLSTLGVSVLQRQNIKANALIQTYEGEPGGFVAKLNPAQVARLQQDPSIRMIEPDRVIALGKCFTVVAPWLVTWNIHSTGFGDGVGKVAWVIDTGIDFYHPDLQVDTVRSRSFIPGDNSAADENGHGTHVAGIIGAKNNSLGVLGVASGATLISLRVLDKKGEGLLSYTIAALGYVSVNGKAGDAVNLSLGEDGVSAILDEQVVNTAAKGIYIAIAAGNDNKPAHDFSPGRVNGPNVYTVAATDSAGKFASFSNYGKDVVDFAAPGVKILSTYLNNQYAIMSGTSMATPHVTGLLLLKGNNISISGYSSNAPDGFAIANAHF